MNPRFLISVALATALSGSMLSGCSDNDPEFPNPPVEDPEPEPEPQPEPQPEPEPEPEPDGTCRHPSSGTCIEGNYHYCDIVTKEERIVECSIAFDNGVCKVVGPISTCVVPEGGNCIVETDGGTSIARCDGNQAACVGEAADAVCVSNVGTCSPSSQWQCLGDHLITACVSGQPRTLDCTTLGGNCHSEACSGLPVGSRCQDSSAGIPRLLCAAGSSCVRELGATYGVCTAD